MTAPKVATAPAKVEVGTRDRIIVQASDDGLEPFVVIIREGVPLVPERVNYKRLESLRALGYEVDDEHGFLVCHCGSFKAWWMAECDACSGEHLDAADDRQMYNDLRTGG